LNWSKVAIEWKMATTSPASTSSTPLRSLLDSAVESHKRDIYDYASGHLNSNKLVQVKVASKQSARWASSSRQKPVTRKSKDVDESAVTNMTSAMTEFAFTGIKNLQYPSSIRSSESVNNDSKTVPPQSATELDARLEKKFIAGVETLISKDPTTSAKLSRHLNKRQSGSSHGSKPSTSKHGKKKIVPLYRSLPKEYQEELNLPEIMLPNINPLLTVPPSLHPLYPGASKAADKLEPQKFVTTHFAGVTCKDQYRKMKDFDQNVLKKSEAVERNVLLGHKAVHHIEQKLVAGLFPIQLKNPMAGFSFERLQLYSDVWNDLTLDSSIFGLLLASIKSEYDLYLSHLLQTMNSSNHNEIIQTLGLVKSLSPTKDQQSDVSLREEVEELMQQSRDALLRNLDLHDQIKSEKQRIEAERKLQQEEDEENMRRVLPLKKYNQKSVSRVNVQESEGKASSLNTVERLKILRVDIWKMLDVIAEKKDEIKHEYISKQSLRNMQHAVKDTEVEIQKLAQLTDYSDKRAQQYQEELYTAVQKSSLDDETVKKMWSLIKEEDKQ